MLSFAPVSPKEAGSLELREQLLALWVEVTDPGGAVGFTAPADRAQVAQALDTALARVAAGRDLPAVIRRDRAPVGMGFLVASGSRLRMPWRTVLRLMVHLALQGSGAGSRLLAGLHALACGRMTGTSSRWSSPSRRVNRGRARTGPCQPVRCSA